MSDEDRGEEGVGERFARHGGDAIGELAQLLLDNPILNQALATALGAGERAMQAQRSAMSALNLPSASEIERLERRLRSLSERLEEVEERLDELEREAPASRGDSSA